MNARGYTLIETVLAASLMAGVALGTAAAVEQTQKWILRHRVRHELVVQSRTCLNTMNRFLRQAQPNSLIISSPPSPAPPCSLIQFTLLDGRPGRIFWENRSVFMELGSENLRSTLAANVTQLNFTGDLLDPSVVTFTLRQEKAIGKYLEVVTLPNQVIRIAGGL